MSPRFVLRSCLAVLFSMCAGCGEKPPATKPAAAPEKAEVLPPVPAGQARLEWELLRAPAQLVAEALVEIENTHPPDAALRDRLLAAGATKVVESTVMGPHGEELKDTKHKVIKEYPQFAWASLWQQQAYEMKEGLPLSKIEDEDQGPPRAEGYSLEAKLDEIADGTAARIVFEWAGAPVIRPVNSWPVKNGEPRIIQERVWRIGTRRTLPAGQRCLLAVAPEPPLADGNNTGVVLLAFARVASGRSEYETSDKADPRTLQCWTLEMPADNARPWLDARVNPADDDARFKSLVREDVRRGTATLHSVMMLRMDQWGIASGSRGQVESRLSWMEPLGFEPPDTRYLPFVPVPNDTHHRSVEHHLTLLRSAANLRLPVGGVNWTRWHGATRGAMDEPTGVEAGATGSSECDFFLRTPGQVFLANAHTCGPKVRLTFARAFFPAKEEKPTNSYTVQVLETPPAPWLPRLAAGVDMQSLNPELTASLTNGSASVLHTEVCTMGEHSIWNREDTWPWVAIATDYINPHIYGGKLCFNPRSMSGSTPACSMKALAGGNFAATLNGEPVSRRLGFWLTDVPGYSAETSAFTLTEWPQFAMMSCAVLPVGRTLLLHVSLGRSWSRQEQPALHWVLFHSTTFPGAPPPPDPNPSPVPDLFDTIPPPPPKVPPAASFTITNASGTILAHATIPATGSSLSDGRMIQSLAPRSSGIRPFQEPEPPAASDRFHPLDGTLDVAVILDGLELQIEDGGKWTLEHSLAPARKITETLLAHTEPPPGDEEKRERIPVSCERLVLQKEKLTGTLPAPGAGAIQPLAGGRTLTIKVR